MKKLPCILFILVPILSFSQTIKGKVLDENKQPLAGANIYFDGTTIATIADENGNFNLNLNSKINSVLVISFIGYQTQYISKIEDNKELIIVLNLANNTLNEVVIVKDKFSRKQKMKVFKELFLGNSQNGANCKITNEDEIYFEYDEKTLTLKAFSNVPLIIVNSNLNYKINYELVNFETKFIYNTMKSQDANRSYYAGLTRFEELNVDKNLSKKREKTYKGSQLHFFRNLVNNIWDKTNFLLFKGSLQDNPNDYFKVTKEEERFKVAVVQQTKGLNSKNFVAEFNLLFNKKRQSKIIFETNTFYVDKFGNNSNIEEILFSGDLSQLKVGDMLPLNYGIE